MDGDDLQERRQFRIECDTIELLIILIIFVELCLYPFMPESDITYLDIMGVAGRSLLMLILITTSATYVNALVLLLYALTAVFLLVMFEKSDDIL